MFVAMAELDLDALAGHERRNRAGSNAAAANRVAGGRPRRARDATMEA
jgi:hypothetical protein